MQRNWDVVARTLVAKALDSRYDATGELTGDGETFIVCEGSRINATEAIRLYTGAKTLRKELQSLENGVIVNFTFTRNYVFDSAFQAAQVVSGASNVGKHFWKPQEAVKEPATPEQTESNIADAMEASPSSGVIGSMLKMLSLTPTPRV